MAKVAFAPHTNRARAVDIARASARWLESEGHEAVVLPAGTFPPPAPDGEPPFDLVVSLGGDGTMLRTVGSVMGTGVPVLGVNFGRFGYLTAAEPDGLRGAVQRFLAGDYQLEHRMTVEASVLPAPDGPPRARAMGLNDVVLYRPSGAHTIKTDVAISGKRFLSYVADSMIVSTPTGSTGYNLSARGPIVSPKLHCLVLTPVSPHMLFDRSVVLDRTDEVSFRVDGPGAAELVVDGVPAGTVVAGEHITCRAGPDALLVTFGGHDFETVLKNKFHLADR